MVCEVDFGSLVVKVLYGHPLQLEDIQSVTLQVLCGNREGWVHPVSGESRDFLSVTEFPEDIAIQGSYAYHIFKLKA